MIKKLTAVGNSFAVIIDRPILDLLDIAKDTPLDVTTDGKALIIRPVEQPKKDRVRASGKKLMAKHAETLRKLAR